MSTIGERRQKLPLKYPFRKAVKNLRQTCLNRERSGYDLCLGSVDGNGRAADAGSGGAALRS